ncbi:MAG: hypothetical protein K5928_07775 [Prevotella sp.]|nr:hypothetical protein [Prevotella sp.]
MNKNLLKSMLVAAGMTASMGAWAQADVTSQYLTNADFSQGTPITVGVCTYAKDMTNNGTEYSQLVPVEGWDIPANGDARAGGLVAFGSGVWIGGPGYVAPLTNSDGESTGNILGLVGVWTGTAQYTQNATLPAGTYTLVLGVYNSKGGTSAFSKNLIGFIENGGTEHLATTTTYAVNTWKYEFITFTLAEETAGKFSLGYTSANAGSGSMPHLFLSGIQLFNGEINAEEYEAAKQETREFKEYTILLTEEINKVKASEDADELADAIAAAEQALANATTSAELKQALEALKAAEEALADSKELAENTAKLEGSSYANPSADQLVNGSFDTADLGWSLNNMKYQANNERPTRYIEQWTSQANNGHLNDGSATQTLTNMPAGAYVLTGEANAVQQANAELEITGVTISVNSQPVDVAGPWHNYEIIYNHQEAGDITVTIAFTETNANWVAFDDFKLVYGGDYEKYMQDKDNPLLGAKKELQEAIANATSIADVPTGKLFQKDAADKKALEDAVAAAQAALDAEDATQESLAAAKTTLEAAVEAFKAAGVVLPDADKAYVFQLMQKDSNTKPAASVYLALNVTEETSDVVLSDAEYPFYFEATEGGYFLKATDTENYVGIAGNNNWTMSADADKKAVITVEVMADGYYALKEAKGYIGVDNVEAGSLCYANKAVSNEWEIIAGTPTGLTTVNTAAAAGNAAIYNLAGQQVKSAQKGLYIKNGRKYIVK